MFTADELNALAQIVSAAPITGKDAKFVANLLDKIAGLIQEAQQPKE